jgi:cyclopropane fatty-acyl-phospholipid synthase-like methyltransferase/methyltransferase-like protein
MQTNLTSYDVVAYPGYSHPQTLPGRLAVIAILSGLEPKPADHCRVLELGCGDGSNLVPMASTLPGSEFLGLDLAANPIARGQQMIRDVGLTNIQLLQSDLSGFKGTGEKFDYIIAHGMFSWVPPDVRRQLLGICRALLAPQGIAFVSYNAFPGAHLRNMLREMMLFHVRGAESPLDRVHQAQALIKFLADAQDVRDEYQHWMKAELESIHEHEKGHIYHDELAEINEPLYFTQFISQAEAHDLQYLGEADYFEMFDYRFNDSTREILKQLGSNRLLREQYLDFLKFRRFRQTLLCHREAVLQPQPAPDRVTNFYISSLAKCGDTKPDLSPGIKVAFKAPKGQTCETDYPLGKAALAVLAENELLPTRFEDLLHQAELLLNSAGIVEKGAGEPCEKLRSFLLELYRAGVVEFRSHLPVMARTVSERPAVSPLVRWQIQHGDFVTSQLHTGVKIEDEIGRGLLSSLDGTLTCGDLSKKLWELLKSKNPLTMKESNEADMRRKIENDLKKSLEQLARIGLLVG